MKKNKNSKIGFIILGVVLIISVILLGKFTIDSFNRDSDNSENTMNNSGSDVNNDEYKYLTQLPTFKDDFEKALFVYGWFYSAETLNPYIDLNNEKEDHYYLLKIENFKTISDMKEYAYEVFDKDFIDSKFSESISGNTKWFKETKDGILVLLDAAQYSYDMGYTDYNKVINTDGTISYKVNIKESIMGDDYKCDTVYEYKMEKNAEGKYVFKTFESPVDICLNDANSK